jgi:uncharacterized protein DUF4394
LFRRNRLESLTAGGKLGVIFSMRTSKNCVFLLLALIGGAIPLHAETLVGLLSDKTLRYFDSTTPSVWFKTVVITGIPDAESVVALDFRPNGVLAVFSREGATVRTYDVDSNTGAVITTAFTIPESSANQVSLDSFGPNVHGSTDLVLTTNADVLRRFGFTKFNTSAIAAKTLFYDNDATDGDPVDIHSGANPVIVGLGSTNGSLGARASVLYGIDGALDSLVKINWDTGSMDTIATLKDAGGTVVGVAGRTGFDISALTGIAYLTTGVTDSTTLYTVDLTTGLTTSVGSIGPAFQQAGVSLQDVSVLPPTELGNISTRATVGTGDNVMIAGFIAQGGASARLIIRGIGPSLGAFGVANPLANPVLAIFDGNGVQIASNDDWKSDQQTEITQTHLAPSQDAEAAYVGTFPPGLYTAKVSGNNGGTGVGLVEIYRLPDL